MLIQQLEKRYRKDKYIRILLSGLIAFACGAIYLFYRDIFSGLKALLLLIFLFFFMDFLFSIKLLFDGPEYGLRESFRNFPDMAKETTIPKLYEELNASEQLHDRIWLGKNHTFLWHSMSGLVVVQNQDIGLLGAVKQRHPLGFLCKKEFYLRTRTSKYYHIPIGSWDEVEKILNVYRKRYPRIYIGKINKK